LLNVLAFVLGAGPGRWIVLAVAAVMLVGTALPNAGLFKLLYARLLRPAGLLKPHVVPDDPVPHLFAQGMGGTVLLAGFLLLLAGVTVAGWVLVWLVVALALVNVLFSFCAGCFLYYQLHRRGLLPFAHR
ncbi:MAG TPA: DUF4395 family protein, partial [Dehalococcoidia bacterium]